MQAAAYITTAELFHVISVQFIFIALNTPLCWCNARRHRSSTTL